MLGVRAGPIGGTLPSIPIVLSIFALASGFTIGCHPCARAARGRPRWPACGSGAGPGGRGRRTRASTQRGSRWSAEPARPGGRAQHGHRHLHDRRPLAVRAAGVHPGQAGGVDEPEVAVQGQVARPVGGGPEQRAQPVDVVPAQVAPEGLGRCRLAVGRAQRSGPAAPERRDEVQVDPHRLGHPLGRRGVWAEGGVGGLLPRQQHRDRGLDDLHVERGLAAEVAQPQRLGRAGGRGHRGHRDLLIGARGEGALCRVEDRGTALPHVQAPAGAPVGSGHPVRHSPTESNSVGGPMPGWVQHAMWWQVYPLGFLGAEPTAIHGPPLHRLPRLVDWLDYAVELGASGLALGPVFASETHGYDTVDHLRIDPRLGTEADFDALVEAAHSRGLRVLLDGVFNHVGRSHPAFRAVLEQGPSAPSASWFRLTWPRPWEPGVQPEAADFEGHGALVALNHDEPAVADHVVEVMNHWLDRGADGWRLDAAYAVPTSFWATVLSRVRAKHPAAYLVGEVIQGDYAEFVTASTMDSVTQYELWKAIWSALNSANFFELSWALQRHDGFLDTFVPLTFVGNHDVTRIASRLSDERDLPLALAILLTVGGTPSV